MNLANEIRNLNIAIMKRSFSMDKECLNKNPPSPLQIQIIRILEENEGKDVCQKDLEQELNISKAAISGVIKTMVKKGIVERIHSSTDGRKNKIVLSQQSKEIYQEKLKQFKILNEELISGISDSELLQFKKTINKMKENLKKEENNV